MCRNPKYIITYLVLIFVLFLNNLIPNHASAHANSYGYMDIHETPEEVQINLSLDYTELTEAFAFPINLDSSTTIEEMEKALNERKDILMDYIYAKIKVYRDELTSEPQLIHTKVSMTNDDYPIANFELLYPVKGESTRVAYNLFVDDINRSHINFATVTDDNGTQEFTFTIAEREMTIGERNWLKQAWNFTILGIEHILTGYDHVLFLLCLIIPATVSIGKVVEVVTSFTLGHSITLGLATLGIVSLPSNLVESAIALSIIYVAIENLFKMKTKNRWILTLLFGLIHGFGFAGILQEMELSRSTIASSLLFFNIGVELGQIAIIAVVFPLLLLFRRYHKFPSFVYLSSASILIIGLFWFVQRATGI